MFNRRRGDDGACEVGGGVLIRLGAKTENIYNTTEEILIRAKANNVTTNVAALNIANERIETRKREQSK